MDGEGGEEGVDDACKDYVASLTYSEQIEHAVRMSMEDGADLEPKYEDASFCVRVSGASEAVCIQRIYIYIIPSLSTAAESNCSLTVHSPVDHDHSCSL